jgi:hypothetical protein
VNFVGFEILGRVHPGSGFNAHDFQTRPGEGQNSDATGGA